MEITSITPAIRVVKESGMAGCDMYISFGDNIRVTDIEGRIFTGIFFYMELGKNEEEDDVIVLGIGNDNVEIQCSYIKNIEEV
ncbi:MAG: hypothetical protein PHW34_14025 [Hespellia sp.]|nr:hypothetical protein [Hespellia sp.]